MTRKKRTLHLDHGRGTAPLDRTFPETGRIKRASGTRDPKMFDLLHSMLGTLYEAGRLDLLRAIKGKVLTPMEVWEHFRTGQLHRLPSPETLKPLRKTVLAWVERYKGRQGQGIHERHRKELKAKMLRLCGYAEKSATVADLPALLLQFRVDAQEEGIHKTFNYARATTLAFARSTVGRGSALYQALLAVETLTETTTGGNPQTVEGAAAWREKLGPIAGKIWWDTCLTGMGPDELWGERWREEPGRLYVDGTKRDRRRRVIPRVVTPTKPGYSYSYYAKLLVRVSGGAIEPYDGRRTWAHLMELAGIPRSRRKAYMGHAGGDKLALEADAPAVLDRYERHNVAPYLEADRAALLAILGQYADIPHDTAPTEVPDDVSVSSMIWALWDSNPGPTDYESVEPDRQGATGGVSPRTLAGTTAVATLEPTGNVAGVHDISHDIFSLGAQPQPARLPGDAWGCR